MPALDGDGPVWQQIRRALVAPILDGRWAPGFLLPVEVELAQRYGVARMTVGKAIQTLVHDGLVLRRRGVGTLVAERAFERPVFEIWDIAALISRAGGRYGYRLLECQRMGREPEKRELLGLPAQTPVLAVRCLHLADERPFQLEERLINLDAAPGIGCQTVQRAGPSQWLMAHVPWTDAEHKIMARDAPGDVAATLQIGVHAACLVVERRTWNSTVPVTFARLWHAGASHHLVGHFQPAR